MASNSDLDRVSMVVLRYMRGPFFALLFVYAIGIIVMSLIPGYDADGNQQRMSLFHSFYFLPIPPLQPVLAKFLTHFQTNSGCGQFSVSIQALSPGCMQLVLLSDYCRIRFSYSLSVNIDLPERLKAYLIRFL